VNDQGISGEVAGRGLSLNSLWAWAVRLVTAPKQFFSALAKEGGYATPILYALFWLYVSTVLELIIGRLRTSPVRLGWTAEIVWLVFGPFILLGMGFLVSAVLFVLWHLMGSKENYATAFRCWAVISPLAVLGAVLGLVPFLNALAFLYGVFLLIIASMETHKISPKKAWAVFGAIGVAFVILILATANIRSELERQGYLNQPGMPGGVPPFAGQEAGEPPSVENVANEIQRQIQEQMAKQGAPAPAAKKK